MADDIEDFEEPAGEDNVRKPRDIRSAFAHASVLSERRRRSEELEVCLLHVVCFMKDANQGRSCCPRLAAAAV